MPLWKRRKSKSRSGEPATSLADAETIPPSSLTPAAPEALVTLKECSSTALPPAVVVQTETDTGSRAAEPVVSSPKTRNPRKLIRAGRDMWKNRKAKRRSQPEATATTAETGTHAEQNVVRDAAAMTTMAVVQHGASEVLPSATQAVADALPVAAEAGFVLRTSKNVKEMGQIQKAYRQGEITKKKRNTELVRVSRDMVGDCGGSAGAAGAMVLASAVAASLPPTAVFLVTALGTVLGYFISKKAAQSAFDRFCSKWRARKERKKQEQLKREALAYFDFDSMPDEPELNKAFRAMSRKVHPDSRSREVADAGEFLRLVAWRDILRTHMEG